MSDIQDNLGKYKGAAVEIIEVIEDLLEKHGIKIPDDDRTGDAGEAPIFGTTFGDLEDEIAEILRETFPDA